MFSRFDFIAFVSKDFASYEIYFFFWAFKLLAPLCLWI